MKLEPPLSNLAARCQTVCVPECCGIDAYDFSPIHIASYLLMWKSGIDEREVRQLRNQLGALKASYGTSGASGHGVTIEEINQGFTAEAIDSLVEEVASNLALALDLVAQSESKRKRTEPDARPNAVRAHRNSGGTPQA